MRKMGTKITASLERVFRLRSCSEDDTIFCVLNYCMSFGIYSFGRSVLIVPGGFAICNIFYKVCNRGLLLL